MMKLDMEAIQQAALAAQEQKQRDSECLDEICSFLMRIDSHLATIDLRLSFILDSICLTNMFGDESE